MTWTHWVLICGLLVGTAFAAFTFGYLRALREQVLPSTLIEGSPSSAVGSAAHLAYVIRELVPAAVDVEVYAVRDRALLPQVVKVYIHAR